ncbi:MAG: cation:proton antiporter [Deltaproteobacteria bacterium]|jgi:CPA2 family monovalent cation:H+ antiporter-2|nr:cation:proton antiporter [Deltaproteobacteria bacterium]
MAHPEILITNMIGLLGLVVVIIFLSLKLKVPPIVGYLITGILVGPFGFKLLTDPEQVEGLTELGVVLLLFTIGLEFSIQSLLKLKRIVLMGGSLQMGLCILLIWPITMLTTGYKWNSSFLIGCLVALSSTAIVLKLLQDRGEMDAAHGRGSLGILIFQDIAVVPLILILPILAGTGSGSTPIYMVLVKIVGIAVLVIIMANWIIPWVMLRVAQTRSSELFMFTVALICLGTAALTNLANLSMPLGAFLAGLIIAGSPYATQAISSVIPMRDIFTSFFFVSIGLRMDISYLLEHPFLTLGISALVMVLNVITAAAAMRITGLSPRVSILIGFCLCQIGEFAFVLAATGSSLKLLPPEAFNMFLNVAVITMALTPLAIVLGHKISPWFAELEQSDIEEAPPSYKDHAIVVGFGVAGQAVARACHAMNKPYVVIDMNPASVRSFRELNEPLFFGDAASEHVLEHIGIEHACILVISIPDPTATRRIIATARKLNPDLKILARTRFMLHIKTLKELGANEVIAEEFEAAIAVFNSMLNQFGMPLKERVAQITLARQSDPNNFRIISPQVRNDKETPNSPEEPKGSEDTGPSAQLKLGKDGTPVTDGDSSEG